VGTGGRERPAGRAEPDPARGEEARAPVRGADVRAPLRGADVRLAMVPRYLWGHRRPGTGRPCRGPTISRSTGSRPPAASRPGGGR